MIREILTIMNYVDGIADTPFHDASNPIIITEYTYTSARMGNVSLTAMLMYPECLDDEWDGRQYVEFRGEKYFVNGTPSSSKDNEDARYKHDITFMAERDIKLNNVYFYDAVSDASAGDDKYRSNSTKVAFFGTISEFAARLGESLKYSGIDYTVVVDDGITSEAKLMSFEDQFFFNVLQEIYNVYNLPFYFEGKTIHIGYTANAITHPFKYGSGNELLSIKKNNENFRIINRCSGTGSEDNIPYYYPNSSPKGDISAKTGDSNTGVTQQDIIVVDTALFSEKMDFVTPLIYKGAVAISSSSFEAAVVNPATIVVTRPVDPEANQSQNIADNTRAYSRVPGPNYKPVDSDGIQVKFGKKSDQWVKNIYLKITSTATAAGRDTLFSLNTGYRWIDGSYYSSLKRKAVIDSGRTPENCTIKDYTGADNTFIVRADAAGTIIFYLLLEISMYDLIYAGSAVDYEYAARYNVTFSATYNEATKWEHDGEPVESLADYGISIGDAVPQYGDEIYMTLDRYVTPSQKLLPSIYRETYGAERFYNALNETYTNPESGKFYVFENEYIPNAPKEHIQDFPDIKPTITGITNKAGQRFDTVLDVAFDDDDNDDVDEEGKYLHPYFFVKLPKYDGEYGFNLFEQQIDEEEMSISMTSGNCGACEFTIDVSDDERQANLVQVDSSGNLLRDKDGNVRCGRKGMPEESPQDRQNNTLNNEVWIALKKEESTYGQIMPNVSQNLKVAKDDTFVILHIDLPLAYIENAEKRLEDAIIKYMAENNSEKFNFSIDFSRIYLAEHPDIAAQLNENARIQIEYNNRLIELYISQYTYKCIDDEALPEVTVELSGNITINKTVLQNTADAIAMDVQNGIANIDFLTQGLRYFLRKDTNDESLGIPTFLRGANFGKFSSGFLGSGAAVRIDENNSSHFEVDYLSVRKRADFTQITVQELKSIGGQLILSPAAMVCSEVEELEDAYRCYFDTDGEDGQPATYNQFVVGDQARMQHFNQLQIAYYWRLVTGVGENYIDLSKTDCDTGSDIPMAGDNIVQLGNRNDTTRQSAQILSCYGDDAPSFVMYNGINSYNLTEKNIVGITYNLENKEPQLYCYGSMFFGDKNIDDPDATYIAFQQKEGESKKRMFINADMYIGPNSSGLSNLSEWSGKQQQIDNAQSAASDAQDSANAAQSTADEALRAAQNAQDFIDNTLPDEIAEINNRLDGVVENWFYEYTPTRQNEPAATWISEGEEADHVGDTFTNIQQYVDDATTPDAGKSWRWALIGGQYNWTPIADSDAVKALQQAAKAQDTADQKRRTFITTPYTPYDVGDMWMQGPDGEIMRCIKARQSGEYTASDWDKASKYTDDTKANEALDAIESLKVGGRNLLLGSNPMITGTGYPTDTFQLTENISDGTECSISIKGQLGTGKTRWGIYNSGGSVSMTELTDADKDENGIYRKTFTWRISSAANTYVSIYPMPQMSGNEPESSIEWVMLEYGNIPGSWSLAPEDIKQTFDSITNFTDEAFADGVIDRAEAAAIEKYINNIKEIQKSAEGTYTTLYNNADLTGTPKTELSSIYGGLVSVTNSLVTLINNVTADKIITDQDKSAVDASYDRVNAFLQDFNTAVENATKAIQARMKMKSDILASASMGNMLYTDPEFSKGMNSVRKYANSGSELVTLTRKEVSGVPNTSGYGIEIVSQEGTIQPGRGGFTFSTQTHANCMMVCRFIAKIPEGRTVEFVSNNTGDDPTRIWLTDNAGTGQWAEYAYYVRAGATGVLSTTFYFYISGTDEVTWYLAYATVFELASDNKRISDLEYLKDTFGYVVDVNGVVLGRLVAVKDDNGNVQAMLNGSDLGKDTFNGYGKLLFASGMSGLQNPQTAETRIYEDGTIITKRLIAEEGGKIGDFQIASSGSGFGLKGSAQNAGTLYEYDRNSLFMPIGFYLHGTAKSEENVMNGMDRSAKIIGVPFGGLNSGDGEGMFPPVGQNSAFAVSSFEKKDTALAPVNIGIYVKASGHRDPSRNVAFRVPEGIFEGLRPSIKFSNSATVELAEFDHTVITHRSSSQTFLLPSSPKEGQHYEIIKGMDSRITINGNGKGIWTVGAGGIQESPYIDNGRFRIFLDYTEDIGDVSDDGGWIMTWFAM